MIDGDIDYSKYSTTELKEALTGIDKVKYPKNYQLLKSACIDRSDQSLLAMLSEKSNIERITNYRNARKPLNYSIFHTNFMCSSAFIPMYYIVSSQEQLFDITETLIFTFLFIFVCIINIDSFKRLFTDSRSRNAWIVLALSTALMGFARLLNSDILLLLFVLIWIFIFIACWNEINTRYIEHLILSERIYSPRNRS
jgi:hypothetical protein